MAGNATGMAPRSGRLYHCRWPRPGLRLSFSG